MSGTLADDSLASPDSCGDLVALPAPQAGFRQLFIVVTFYLVAIFADFLAITIRTRRCAPRYLPPQACNVRWRCFNPYVNG